MAQGNFLRVLRTGLLLLVLIAVAGSAYLTRQRTTSWTAPLRVTLYPINGDGSEAAERYIRRSSEKTYLDVETFFARESKKHGINHERPFRMYPRAQISELPPPPPATPSRRAVMLWSLKLRHWVWQVEQDDPQPRGDIALFVIYHDPDRTPVVPHSVGLQKGMIGVVHAFASRTMRKENNVVIAHELLHTVGASDKYDPATNLPLHPDGYAEPERRPLHPQRKAEIMAGRIPHSDADARQAPDLDAVVVGPLTAQEIRWIK